jgi:hypothetical protein
MAQLATVNLNKRQDVKENWVFRAAPLTCLRKTSP